MIEQVFFDEDADCLVAAVRARKGAGKLRCGICARRCGRYDRGEGLRRWRTLDLGVMKAFLEAEAPRVNCPEHGPTVVQVPWARHGAGHTRTRVFDDQVAWLVTHTSKSAVTELDAWLSWARRCRIPSFVDLYYKIVAHRDTIINTLKYGLSNGLIESTNTKLRLITRMAYGFKSTDNLIALCLLDMGGYCPPLPGRQAA